MVLETLVKMIVVSIVLVLLISLGAHFIPKLIGGAKETIEGKAAELGLLSTTGRALEELKDYVEALLSDNPVQEIDNKVRADIRTNWLVGSEKGYNELSADSKIEKFHEYAQSLREAYYRELGVGEKEKASTLFKEMDEQLRYAEKYAKARNQYVSAKIPIDKKEAQANAAALSSAKSVFNEITDEVTKDYLVYQKADEMSKELSGDISKCEVGQQTCYKLKFNCFYGSKKRFILWRLFMEDKKPPECMPCSELEDCSEYFSKSECEGNSCAERMRCEWKSNVCVAAP